ncbi:MAG: hypothetical protein ACM3XM_10440 [Mycobacterium leprae]
MKRALVGLLTVIFLLVAGAGIALAEDRQPFLVPDGHRVADVVIMGQDVVIAGQVEHGVIVLFGNLTLAPTAQVRDDVVVIGGTIQRDPNAQLRASVFTFAAGLDTLAALGWGLATYSILAGLRLLWISAVVLSAVLWGVRPYRNPDAARLPSLWRLLAIGALWAAAVVAVAGGLSSTLWGIPAAFTIALVALVLSCIGLGILSLRVGSWLAAQTGRQIAPWKSAALGAGTMALFTGIPVVGALAVVLLMTLGLGQFVLKLRHTRWGRSGEIHP